MNADGLKFRDAIIEFLPDATFVIDLEGKVIMWNSAMEMLTNIPAASILGKGDYEYALPFYKQRRPMLANLIFIAEAEIEKKYDTVQRVGDTLVVEIFIPDFKPGRAAVGHGQDPILMAGSYPETSRNWCCHCWKRTRAFAFLVSCRD